MKNVYVFEPLPCPSGSGVIHLTIYPPGTFCNNTDFSVHVGGCGVGHTRTLAAAEVLLAKEAHRVLTNRREAASRIADHYGRILDDFTRNGLGKRRVREHD